MELLANAIAGFNIIPTALLGLIILYWAIAILGLLDFEFLDLDLDLDADGMEVSGPLNGLAMFLNVGQVPVPVVLSLLVLNFWIIAMMMYYLPLAPDNLLYGLLMLPAAAASFIITRFEMIFLGGVFKNRKKPNSLENKVMDHRCTLMCDVKEGRMGQAEVIRQGANLILNVKAEFAGDSFEKGEVAFVFRRDKEKDIYYITKPIVNYQFHEENGEVSK